MKRLVSMFVLGALTALVGCNQNDTTAEPVQDAGGDSAVEDHDHSHDQGDSIDHRVEGHAHGVGPHDGTIADWGGGTYHVELIVDHEKQQATIYVLGSDEQTPTPIDAESIELSITDPQMQVTLQAAPQQGDPEGMSSRFAGTHEDLGVAREYAGTMTGVVDGTPYSGDFKEEAHGNSQP